jgi:hypothetical protein
MHTGMLHDDTSHQHDIGIPDEDKLLRRLQDKYTPVSVSIPQENLPSAWNDTDELREFLKPSLPYIF